MQSKCMFLICLILLSQTAHCASSSERAERRAEKKAERERNEQKTDQSFIESIRQAAKGKAGLYLMPIFFGGTTFLSDSDQTELTGYALSGGITSAIFKGDLFFFGDALYSYRDYDGIKLNSRIEETTADIAAGIGMDYMYVGGVVHFPLHTKLNIKAEEWTMEDFEEAGLKKNNISRTTSASFMFGLRGTLRILKARLGADMRFMIGQGPGSFLNKSLGDNILGHISLGVMAGF